MGWNDRGAAEVDQCIFIIDHKVSILTLDRYQADIGVGAVQVATEKECVVDFTTPWYERVGFLLMMKAHRTRQTSGSSSTSWTVMSGWFFSASSSEQLLCYTFTKGEL